MKKIIITGVVIAVLLLSFGAYKYYKLLQEVKSFKETTLFQSNKVIDSLRIENQSIFKKLEDTQSKLDDYKSTLKKIRELNNELIKKTKDVYIPELHANRTSRELLQDLERHRKYMFISTSILDTTDLNDYNVDK